MAGMECLAGCFGGLALGVACGIGGPPVQMVTVNPDEIAAKETCGSFVGLIGPGFQIMGPGSKLRKVSTRVRENQVVCETKTSDNVFVKIHIAVQQTVDRNMAKEAVYKLEEPNGQIDSFVADVVRSHVPQTTLDSLFQAKDEIASDVQKRLSSAMKSYGYNILKVLVTDISPDDSVKAAMNQINASKRNRHAAMERAEADKLVLIKAAEAEMTSKKLQGEGIARSRKAIIEGLKNSVTGQLQGGGEKMKPQQVTELLIMTQYLETLEKMSTGAATVVFTPTGSSATDTAAALAMKKMMK